MVDVKLICEYLGVKSGAFANALASKMTIRKVARGAMIHAVGTVTSEFVVLVNGVTRFFYEEDGVEYTECFVKETGFPLMDMEPIRPSAIGIGCVTECTILTMPMYEYVDLLHTEKEALIFQNHILQSALMFHCGIKRAITNYDSTERFLWFLERFAGVDIVAKSSDIASFLGMKPETLSRVRKKVREANPALVLKGNFDFYGYGELLLKLADREDSDLM